MSLFTFKGKMLGQMTDDDFSQLCADNPHLRLERDADGTILVDMPNHSYTGEKTPSLFFKSWHETKLLNSARSMIRPPDLPCPTRRH